jgi:diaminohydroxyphosphoribosylaminopyrimidine deaminase/5-amino-6-(5-phosphoribosylamino)uracil reductase
MERALDLALGGWGRVSPNPLVGAVLLRGGEIVGEGYHGEFGTPHAEAAALAACTDPAGTTCVVNLEPCSHEGKTPPCAGALVEARVKRIVFGVRDPSALAGRGAEYLRSAGLEVDGGVLAERAAALNAPFLWSETRPERPFLAIKLATSLDGFVADRWGKSQWITGPEARDHVHWLRAGYDGVAVGRRTAEADNATLTARGSLQPRVPPARVVFGRSGKLRRDLQLVQTAHGVPTVLLTDPGVRASAERSLDGTGVSVLGCAGLEGKLRALREAGLRSLLVEGGAELVGELLQADLVDRVYLFQAPVLLGQGLGAFPSGTASPLGASRRWVPVERRAFGDSNLLVVDRELCLPE